MLGVLVLAGNRHLLHRRVWQEVRCDPKLLLEVMEQLTLSLAKAGTNCRLYAHDFPLDAANSVRVAVEVK